MSSKKLAYISILVAILALISFIFFDQRVVEYFYSIKGGEVYQFFRYVTKLGQSEYLLIPAIFIFLYFRKKNRTLSLKAGFIFSSIALSGVIVNIIKPTIGRVRPNIYFEKGESGFNFFTISHDFTSFPSGHSATAFALSVTLALLYKQYKYLLIFIACMVAISRVVIIRHYPSDILIGSLIGVVVSIMLYEKYFKKEIHE